MSRVLQIHGQLQVVLVVLELRLRVSENLNDYDHVARAELRSNVLYVTVRYSDRRHRDLSFDSGPGTPGPALARVALAGRGHGTTSEFVPVTRTRDLDRDRFE